MDLVPVEATSVIDANAVFRLDPVEVPRVVTPRDRNDFRYRWHDRCRSQFLHLCLIELSLARRDNIKLTILCCLVAFRGVPTLATLEAETKVLFVPAPPDPAHDRPPLSTMAAASTVASSRIPEPRSSISMRGLLFSKRCVRNSSIQIGRAS